LTEKQIETLQTVHFLNILGTRFFRDAIAIAVHHFSCENILIAFQDKICSATSVTPTAPGAEWIDGANALSHHSGPFRQAPPTEK
jgi:hypothetical protein